MDFSSLKGKAVVQPMANIHYTVSYGIKDSQGNLYYYIIIDKPGKAWMMKSGFVGTLFNVVINQHLTPQGKEVPYFMKQFHEVSLKGPDGKYKRNKKNYVGTRVATVVRVPKTGLPPNLCITNAIDQIGNFMKRDDIGEMFGWQEKFLPCTVTLQATKTVDLRKYQRVRLGVTLRKHSMKSSVVTLVIKTFTCQMSCAITRSSSSWFITLGATRSKTLPTQNWARSSHTTPRRPFPPGKISKRRVTEGILVSLAEQYVFTAAQAACLDMVCREVAPPNCVEIRNVFNESVNQI